MTLSRRWVRGAVWVVLLMVGSVLARAQEVSGSISGTVVDANGCQRERRHCDPDEHRPGVCRADPDDQQGRLLYGDLASAGNLFRDGCHEGIQDGDRDRDWCCNANDDLKVDQKLVVGAATETVNIVADAGAVEHGERPERRA